MTDRPTPEFFDPMNPHIGFAGSEFGPPTSGLDFAKMTSVRKAGARLNGGIQEPALRIIEVITGLAEAGFEDLEEWVLSIPIIGDIWVVVKKVITGEGDIVIPDILGDARDFLDNLDLILKQILDVFNGLVVTPINEAVAGVVDWFQGLLGFRESVEPAGYWDLEALVASANVALGVNELLVGMHLHQNRTITGIHYALAANTGTLTVQTRLDGAIVHTATISSGEVRKSYPVNVAASDKQRVSWNVTGSTGVATVLSVAVTGEYR